MNKLVLSTLLSLFLCTATLHPARADDAEAVVTVTNGGEPVPNNSQIQIRPAGEHNGGAVTWGTGGSVIKMPAGTYDVQVTFSDGAAEKTIWLDGQTISGHYEKTVEIGMPVASVTYHLTNNGEDAKGNTQVHLYVAGHRDGGGITWAGSGDTMRIAAGAYDVHATFEDGAAHQDIWLDNQQFTGKVDKTVDFSMKVASVTYHLTNNGDDAKGNAQVHLYPAGHRDDNITWGGSGDAMRIPAGAYDVHATYEDGAAHQDMWLENQQFDGTVDKSVDFAVNVASVTYHLTNNGEDAKGHAQVHLYPAGHRDDNITWGGSGDEMRIPAGAYDVHATYEDGAAHQDMWLENQQFAAGKIEKTVDFAEFVARVTYHITNDGEDAKGRALVHIFPAGKHDDNITWAGSGEEMRLQAGTYDLAFSYNEGLVNKQIWQNGEALAGKIDKTVELGIVLAHPTVNATLNGADVGNKASIHFTPAGTDNELGQVPAGTATVVEAGRYDLAATMPGAEGMLAGTAIAGKQTLTIAMQPLKTEQLKVGGPLPKACTIEVYGVNFDFDKSVLRPDSEPMLKSVLKLFTGTPSFSAEVGGHTDNIGKPDYNLKLSDARADAVKDWLVSHGVAATRVSARGYGDTRPLVPNDTDANRFKNRRVELKRNNCH
jgi:outer membrane protein OmpA-like peptidoglycan-associated protein